MDLSRLRAVSNAVVLKGDTPAGTITRHPNGELTFSYRSDYDGPPIASTLPISGEPRTGNGLPPFFTGLLPEGHRLTTLSRAIKTSLDDELSLLLAVGLDTPGDVQIVEAGTNPVPVPPLLDLSSPHLNLRDIVDSVDRTALPGVQPKASAHMISAPVATREGGAIVKIDPEAYPHLVTNEHFHLQKARTLKIRVAHSQLISDSHGTTGLAVWRFDRAYVAENDTIQRIPFEDGAQVLNVHPSQKYNVTSEDLVIAVSALCPAQLVAKRALYLQFLFAWLTGNGDLHAKNVGVLGAPGSSAQIAPMYDIPCTLVYGDDSMAISVCGKTRRLRRRHWDEFAKSIGLPRAAARSAQALALKAAQGVDLNELPFSGSILRGAERELLMRRHEISAG